MTIAALALGSAFILTILNRLYSKHALNTLDSYALTVLSNGFAALLTLPFFLFYARPISDIGNTSIALAIFLGFLWSIAAWAINASIAYNDFSFKEVIRQTRVVWVVLGGVLVLNEVLGFFDIAGILCIAAGVLLISYKKFTFKQHLTSRPILLAWFSSILVAVITLLEKYLLGTMEVIEYAQFNFIFSTTFLLLLGTKGRRERIKSQLMFQKKEVFLFSLLMTVTYTAGITTYKYMPISIAYPIIQSASIFAILVGTRIFENNEDVPKKVFAAVLSVLGIILIQLF